MVTVDAKCIITAAKSIISGVGGGSPHCTDTRIVLPDTEPPQDRLIMFHLLAARWHGRRT